MRTTKRKSPRPKVNIVSLGCHKNLVDSEDLLTQLNGNGFFATIDQEIKSDITVINTCGFIGDAKEQSIETILNWVEAKKKGMVEKIIVMGCLSERYTKSLREEIPEVDHFFGTNQIEGILETLEADYKKELIGERVSTTPAHYAYLKISEGCNRKCAFCAIPLMRGKHVSKPFDQIILEAKNIVAKGVKELILIAQDLTFYGFDLYKKNRLAELLDNLANIKDLKWIRLHYTFPTGFPLEIAEVMAKRDTICKYLDIPLQHASDKMLKKMRRGITKQKTIDLINYIRKQVPNIAIRTTFIVGFPDETEDDFQILLDFIEEMKFERVGVFKYSHEEDTYAHKYEDNVPLEIKEERAERLMDLQRSISLERNRQAIGKSYKVLFDNQENGFWIGRTEHDSPEVDNQVLIAHTSKIYSKIHQGDFKWIEIQDADEFDLYGK